jgi:hypothetical protein
MGKMFWAHHGLDRDLLLAVHQAAYDAEQAGVLNPLEVIWVL